MANRVDALGAHLHAVAEAKRFLRHAAAPPAAAMRLGHDGVIALAKDAALPATAITIAIRIGFLTSLVAGHMCR